ncbi:hypothetical protein J437_LFUL016513 [Ladona fulva]|uniref:Uncharacterized protein n=1 Tax=Ladona fulva TaxID=123851 RepID=A0A8K0KSF1_LADFU|nr:hypothetical protein J437_LFUL016513 [Ladona fulva]
MELKNSILTKSVASSKDKQERKKSSPTDQPLKLTEEKLKKGEEQKSIQEEWNDLKKGIITVLEQKVGTINKKEARKNWINQNMLEKMEERRKWKEVNSEQGRMQIRTEDEDIKGIWEEYIKDRYCTNDRGREVEIELRNYEEGERDNGGPKVMKEEIEMAIKRMNGKAVGGDQIPIEILKSLRKNGMDRLTNLINKIYDTGELSEDLLKTIMVLIPKKAHEDAFAFDTAWYSGYDQPQCSVALPPLEEFSGLLLHLPPLLLHCPLLRSTAPSPNS